VVHVCALCAVAVTPHAFYNAPPLDVRLCFPCAPLQSLLYADMCSAMVTGAAATSACATGRRSRQQTLQVPSASSWHGELSFSKSYKRDVDTWHDMLLCIYRAKEEHAVHLPAGTHNLDSSGHGPITIQLSMLGCVKLNRNTCPHPVTVAAFYGCWVRLRWYCWRLLATVAAAAGPAPMMPLR
jgi:hypothetical protein